MYNLKNNIKIIIKYLYNKGDWHMKKVTLEMIQQARETIKDIVKETPLLESVRMSDKTGANVFLKCENLQKTGSFKIRGAYFKIFNLSKDDAQISLLIVPSPNISAKSRTRLNRRFAILGVPLERLAIS